MRACEREDATIDPGNEVRPRHVPVSVFCVFDEHGCRPHSGDASAAVANSELPRRPEPNGKEQEHRFLLGLDFRVALWVGFAFTLA